MVSNRKTRPLGEAVEEPGNPKILAVSTPCGLSGICAVHPKPAAKPALKNKFPCLQQENLATIRFPVQIGALMAGTRGGVQPVPTDGRLEVALGIASVTALVTVDARQQPFTTVPDDLFDRTFNDPQVGISDEQMAAFKAALARLLPQIADDIAQIPENSALSIEEVATLVKDALLADERGNH
jgi:hypothetical protein